MNQLKYFLDNENFGRFDGGDVGYRYNGIPTNEVTVGILRNGTAQTLDLATNTTSVVLKYIGDLGDGSAGKYSCTIAGWDLVVTSKVGTVTSFSGSTPGFTYTPESGDTLVVTWRWDRVKKPVAVPASYWLVDANGAKSAPEGFPCLYDGSLDQIGPGDNWNLRYAGMDFGRPYRLERVVYAPRPTLESRIANSVLEGSNDGTSWTQVGHLTNSPVAKVLNDVPLDDNRASYRYYRFGGTSSFYGNVAELKAMASTGIVIRMERPDPWNGGSARDQADAADGVLIAAKVGNH